MGNDFCTRVGTNIKKYRKERNMTLKELADKIDLTEATVQKYEAGNIKKIDLELFKKMADVLEVKPEELAGWETEEEYQSQTNSDRGKEEARLIKKYSQLTTGHKQAVKVLIDNLLECQEKNNSDK